MICPKCQNDFTAKRAGQRFCCVAHKDAWHNARKLKYVMLCDRAFYYVHSLAASRHITNSEMTNEMILKISNSGQENLMNEEAAGLREANELR